MSSAQTEAEWLACYLPRVQYIARFYGRSYMPYEDRVAVGLEGLLVAYRRGCPEGVAEGGFVSMLVKRYIVQALRDWTHCRAKRTVYFESIDAPIEGEDGPFQRWLIDETDDLDRAEMRYDITRALDALDARHRGIVVARYLGDMTNPAIASCLGVHESRVSQLCQEGLRTMREVLSPQERLPT